MDWTRSSHRTGSTSWGRLAPGASTALEDRRICTDRLGAVDVLRSYWCARGVCRPGLLRGPALERHRALRRRSPGVLDCPRGGRAAHHRGVEETPERRG